MNDSDTLERGKNATAMVLLDDPSLPANIEEKTICHTKMGSVLDKEEVPRVVLPTIN